MNDIISQLTQNPIERELLNNLFSIDPTERAIFLEMLINGTGFQQKRQRKIKTTSPILNIPEYNGAAVYALVDDNEKRYIGSTLHLKNRIKQHNSLMKMVCKHGPNGLVTPKITQALLEGMTFKCEILAQINTDVSKYELEEIERIFLKHYGGLENTYNTIPLKHKV